MIISSNISTTYIQSLMVYFLIRAPIIVNEKDHPQITYQQHVHKNLRSISWSARILSWTKKIIRNNRSTTFTHGLFKNIYKTEVSPEKIYSLGFYLTIDSFGVITMNLVENWCSELGTWAAPVIPNKRAHKKLRCHLKKKKRIILNCARKNIISRVLCDNR